MSRLDGPFSDFTRVEFAKVGRGSNVVAAFGDAGTEKGDFVILEGAGAADEAQARLEAGLYLPGCPYLPAGASLPDPAGLTGEEYRQVQVGGGFVAAAILIGRQDRPDGIESWLFFGVIGCAREDR